jgi:hypothetical protein
MGLRGSALENAVLQRFAPICTLVIIAIIKFDSTASAMFFMAIVPRSHLSWNTANCPNASLALMHCYISSATQAQQSPHHSTPRLVAVNCDRQRFVGFWAQKTVRANSVSTPCATNPRVNRSRRHL